MFKLITFDVYSASLDINGSAVPIVREVLGWSEEKCLDFFKTWRTQQWNFLLLNNSMGKGFLSYRYITSQTLEYALKKYGIDLTEEQKKRLMDIWVSFKAWPEAKEVIEEIKSRGYKVAMLSNGDQDMLEPLQNSSGIKFDYVFSAEAAGAYKPSPAVYDIPFQKTGIKKEEMLHVAGSVFDVMGAKAAGCFCAWSNRYSDYVLAPEYEPDYNMNNLSELLSIL